MPKFCSACGSALKQTDRFCSECGAQLPSAQEAPTTQPALPISSTPSHAESQSSPQPAEENLSSRAASLGADRPAQQDEYDAYFGKQSKNVYNLGVIGKTLSHAPAFFLLYAIAIVPTYILPYLGSNSAFLNGVSVGMGAGAYPLFWLHLTFLYLAAVIAWLRGSLIGRAWLVVLPVFAGFFDLAPGFNWIPLVPTMFHIATLIIGVNRPALPEAERPDTQGRTLAALVGLSLLLVLTIYRWANYHDATQASLADLSHQLNAPVLSAAAASSATFDNSMVAMETPPPAFSLEKVTYGDADSTDQARPYESLVPLAGPLRLRVSWWYHGATVGQSVGCSIDNAPLPASSLQYQSGSFSCTWPATQPGSHAIKVTIDGNTVDERNIDVPAKPVESSLPPTDSNDRALEQSGVNFLHTYYNQLMSDTDGALAFLQSHYADRVNWYGADQSAGRILRERKAYMERWPQRSYTLSDGAVTCLKTDDFCTAEGTVRFSADSAERQAHARGVANFKLRLVPRPGNDFMIKSEGGKVLSRDTSTD